MYLIRVRQVLGVGVFDPGEAGRHVVSLALIEVGDERSAVTPPAGFGGPRRAVASRF